MHGNYILDHEFHLWIIANIFCAVANSIHISIYSNYMMSRQADSACILTIRLECQKQLVLGFLRQARWVILYFSFYLSKKEGEGGVRVLIEKKVEVVIFIGALVVLVHSIFLISHLQLQMCFHLWANLLKFLPNTFIGSQKPISFAQIIVKYKKYWNMFYRPLTRTKAPMEMTTFAFFS